MNKDRVFYLWLFGALLIGAYLRLVGIGSQIVWADEWWPLKIATRYPFSYIFSHYHISDNCIPLTVLYRIFLKTIGLNDVTFRLPQLVTGIAAVAVFPLLLKDACGKIAAIIFSYLIALSPLLIFFSRHARPYSIIVFLGFISIIAFYRWIRTKDRRYAALYAVTAVLTPYFHPYGISVIIVPVIYILCTATFQKLFSTLKGGRLLPPDRDMVIVMLSVTAGTGIWFLPTIGSLQTTFSHVGDGHILPYSIWRSIKLFSGTGNKWVLIVLFSLASYGYARMFKRNKYFCGYVSVLFLTHACIMLLTRWRNIQFALVLTRHSSMLIPLYLLFISVALQDIIRKATIRFARKDALKLFLAGSLITAFLLLLFIQGPIPYIYSFPNNFTNHVEIQSNYAASPLIDKRIEEKHIPDFYITLQKQKEITAVLEVPYQFHWKYCPYHTYQRVHRKNVMVGYTEAYKLLDHDGVHFNNFINIGDPAAIRNSGCSYMIIHKDIFSESKKRLLRETMSEIGPSRPYSYPNMGSKSYVALLKKADKEFGDPIYEDRWIKVFGIQ